MMSLRGRGLALVFMAVGAVPTVARAEEAPARPSESSSRLTSEAFLGGQVNPPALLARASVTKRWVFDASSRDLETYAELGAALSTTPAYAAPRLHAEWSPAPYLILRSEVELLAFPGTTHGVLSFDSAHADFGEAVLRRGTPERGTAHKLQFAPTLRGRVGRVVARSSANVAYYRYAGAGPYFYEVQHDTLVARGDLVLESRTDVLLEATSSNPAALYVGPAYSLTRAMGTGLQRQRVGGALFFTPASQWGPVRRPSLFLDAGVNLEDANRRGQAFVALGFRAEME